MPGLAGEKTILKIVFLVAIMTILWAFGLLRSHAVIVY